MELLNGNEKFTLDGNDTGISVSEFWSWAYSDLLNNTLRGVLAEFLVKKSFSFLPPPREILRTDWTPYDLASPSGRRIEVKSAAYLQSWTEDYFSHIIFDIAPKRAWNPQTGYSPERSRHSDLYVFCLYTARSREQSIRNLDLWEFYVLPTSVLDQQKPNQKSIALNSLLSLEPIKTNFQDLGNIIETITL
ncbi:hypothetical protein [Blautia fusiformis]|uniref:Restriction endonuclease n=1 Tax=Blautia fusiformis TaxID=2881264 RepID=A0AAW4VYT7_9FIRM|nr:hypothetical protein [Blautia fusiformis]MCC2226256.1 hypothetical protein [Blautia fusiformis]